MVVVVYSAWGLLTESLKLSMDAVPSAIDVETVKKQMLLVNGVKSAHHIHIWAMSTTINAMTAHLILEGKLNDTEVIKLKQQMKHELEHLNIQHVTLETEFIVCEEEVCVN